MYRTSLTLKRLISLVNESGLRSLSQSSAQWPCAERKSGLWALQSHVMTALELQEPEHFHFLLIMLMTTYMYITRDLVKTRLFELKAKVEEKTTKWITVRVPMQALIKPINNRWVWGSCLMKQKWGASKPRRWPCQPWERHPPATVTLRTSVERGTDSYQNSIQRGGRVECKKSTITTARKSNVCKMIDSCDSAVKSLRPC